MYQSAPEANLIPAMPTADLTAVVASPTQQVTVAEAPSATSGTDASVDRSEPVIID